MKFVSIFLLTISAVTHARSDLERCIKIGINICQGIFVESYSKDRRGEDACRELEKTFVNCSREAIDNCYGSDGSQAVENKLQVYVDFIKDFCKGQQIYEKYYDYYVGKSPSDKCFLKREISCEMKDYLRRLREKNNCRAKQSRLDCLWDGLHRCPDLYEKQVQEVLEENRYHFNQICRANTDVCALTQWSEWSSCMKFDYGFVKIRMRTYLNKASDNTCNWELMQMEPCREKWRHLSYYADDVEGYKECVKERTSACQDEFVETYSKSKKGVQECRQSQGSSLLCQLIKIDFCGGTLQDLLTDKRKMQYYAFIFCNEQEKYEKYNTAGSFERPDLEESNKCFLKEEMICEENAFNRLFDKGAYTCRERKRKHDCLWNATVICFGQERNNTIFKALKESEDKFKEFCGVDPALCPVSQWSKWSPCIILDDEGQKFRRRRHPSPEYRSICNMELTEKAPCTDEEPNCYVHPTDAEYLSSAGTESKKCFEKKRKMCRENVFDVMFYLYMDYEISCRQLREMLTCLNQSASECSEDDHDEEIYEVLHKFEAQFKEHCDEKEKYQFYAKKDIISITALLMDMFSTGHWKSEECIEENEDYLLDCVRRVMWTGDIDNCSFWKMLFQCTLNRNGVDSFNMTSSKFDEWLPARLLKRCGDYYHRPNID